MIKDNNYVHGTAAKKLEYDVYEENKVLKTKRNNRRNNKIKLNTVALLLMVFAVGCMVMLRYTQITELNYKIDKKEKEYAELKNENRRIEVQIGNELDLRKVKEIAEGKLGMQKPDKYQITYVKVPKKDFTIVSEAAKYEEAKNSNVLTSFMSEVGKVTQLLY